MNKKVALITGITGQDGSYLAEIHDVANVVLDGTDTVMLSEESAVGYNPVLAVETIVKTIQGTEGHYPFHKFSHFDLHNAGDKINESAVRLSENLDISGIIAMSASGQSAKKIARFRPSRTIYTGTHDSKAAQSLTIIWGVVPAFSVDKGGLRMMMGEVLGKGLHREVCCIWITVIYSHPEILWVPPGSTNLIRVITGHEMEFFCSLKRKKEIQKS